LCAVRRGDVRVKATLQGWMEKQGQGNKRFKKRWFVLVEMERKLVYYKDNSLSMDGRPPPAQVREVPIGCLPTDSCPLSRVTPSVQRRLRLTSSSRRA